MAKSKSSNGSVKISFGTRKTGQPNGKKSYNKHSQKPKKSRGQG
jgi:hypothetical protein